MNVAEETVKFKEGGEHTFSMPLPESVEEAIDTYGEENALWLLTSGLKVKLQNVAREGFRQEKSVEEVNEAVRNYRPGSSSRQSVKKQALNLITERAADIKSDPDLQSAVKDAFSSSDFKEVVRLLEED